jgi:hypothetical protein
MLFVVVAIVKLVNQALVVWCVCLWQIASIAAFIWQSGLQENAHLAGTAAAAFPQRA